VALLKTVITFIVVIIPMLILAPVGVFLYLVGFLGLRTPMTYMIYKIAQAWSKAMVMSTGCSLAVTGQEHIPKKGGLCFVSNHSSVFDILLIVSLVGRPVGFIAKKELGLVPFLNIWIFLIGGLFIDRKNIRKALKTINTGIKQIKSGGAMVVFPEGTRSRGQGLLPFRSGALKLATQSGAPIVSIAITGSYDVFERTYRVQSVPVRVTFGPPINTADLSPEERRKNLPDQVRKAISAGLERGRTSP
jgi:1-acyl-sn-glycerol-3-phosphate acyltransferase